MKIILTKLLKGPESAQGVVGQMVIEFNDDESVLEEMSEDNCNFLAQNNLDILMAGVLRFFHLTRPLSIDPSITKT